MRRLLLLLLLVAPLVKPSCADDRWVASLRASRTACDALANELDGRSAMLGASSCFMAFEAPSKEAARALLPDGARLERDTVVVRAAQADDLPPPPPATGDSPDLSWALDRIDQADLPLDGSFEPVGNTSSAAAANIYVLDSGINTGHKDFGNRARALRDMTGTNVADLDGHGTHVAAVAAGAAFGVAKNARVFSIKVLSGNTGTLQGVVLGLEAAMEHATDVGGVILLALSVDANAVIDDAVAAAAEEMLVVVAAGNGHRDACDVSPARMGGRGGKPGSVITVGASTNADTLWSASNWGACVDLFAPGNDVPSAWIPGNSDWLTLTGTSMAAPLVAGTAALLLADHDMNRTASIEQLFNLTARDKLSGLSPDSPNRLLQVPGSLRPTGPPRDLPEPPTGWTCQAAWLDANDGCDCECGSLRDPDCRTDGADLFCRGRGARYFQTCDKEANVCVSDFTLISEEAEEAEQQRLDKAGFDEGQVEAFKITDGNTTPFPNSGPRPPMPTSTVGAIAGISVLGLVLAVMAYVNFGPRPKGRHDDLAADLRGSDRSIVVRDAEQPVIFPAAPPPPSPWARAFSWRHGH